MILISLSSLALAIGFRSISELTQHGKFILSRKNHLGFWGVDSWRRKYKSRIGKDVPRGSFDFIDAPSNWYYKFFNIYYVEKWPTSATFTVMFTDGMHLMQSLSFLSLSACVSLLSGISFWYVWLGVLAVHFGVYRVFQK
jgi:hypothetical protein